MTEDEKDKKLADMRKAFGEWLEELAHQPSVYEIEDYWMEVIKELI